MAVHALKTKKRLLITLVVFSSLVSALLIRVAWLQIINGDFYQQKAFMNQTRGRTISPKRGSIYDRNGKELAISASVETISVNPSELSKAKVGVEVIAQKLSEILGMDKDKIYKKITAKSRYEILKKKVEKDVGNQVRVWAKEKKIDGIYIDEDSKRYYPNGNLAAHILGFTGAENQGLDGVEATMEQYLKGVPGKILSEVDASGRSMPFNEEKRVDAQDGKSVVLTIDEAIQSFAEKALDKAIDDNKILNGATAIVVDPRTGEVLALASKPDFDPNNPSAPPPGVDPSTWKGTTQEDIKVLQKTVWRNKAVMDTYEPGSTFKAITSAAGLEENAIRPDSPVTDFTVKVGGFNIDCWKPNAHGNETFTQGVYNSCNPVFVRVAQTLGIDTFYKYVKAFGFMDKTGIQLPGEAMSQFHKKPSEVDMAVASFGQRFQITPIQLISAYTAIANGGSLMKPTIIKEVLDSDGNVVKKFEPQVVRNVISKKTDDELKTILEGVVAEGTGSNAYVKGYRVAGKTGTSETIDTKKNGRYIASFSSFAPADNPQICVLVELDYPTGISHMGGMIAAPVAGRIVEETLNYLGVERRYTEKDKNSIIQEAYVPDIRNMTIENAKKKLSESGLEYKIEGSGNNNGTIVDQMPKPNALVPQKSVVILYTYKPVDKGATVKVPDLTNKTYYEAAQALNDIGLNIKPDGNGNVVSQNIKPGTDVQKGEIVGVELRHLDTE